MSGLRLGRNEAKSAHGDEISVEVARHAAPHDPMEVLQRGGALRVPLASRMAVPEAQNPLSVHLQPRLRWIGSAAAMAALSAAARPPGPRAGSVPGLDVAAGQAGRVGGRHGGGPG